MLKVGWIIWVTLQWLLKPCADAQVHCTVNDYGGFIADPYACEKFYFCNAKGRPIQVYCPEGMWFNPKKGICDLPSGVKCEIKPPPSEPTNEEDILCPSEDTSFVTFVASQENCRHYYLCYHGRAFKQECIAELHWNAQQNRCDFPAKARCSIKPRKPLCPVRGNGLIPHDSECDYFYYCIDGYASLQQCPFYHHWDVETQSCQWKNRARCISDIDRVLAKSKKTTKKNKKRIHRERSLLI